MVTYKKRDILRLKIHTDIGGIFVQSYNTRLSSIREKLEKENLDGLLLFPSPNQYYTTGFRTFPGERLLLTVIPKSSDAFFIAPKLYESQIRSEASIVNIYSWTDEENPYEILKELLEERGIDRGRFAVDDTMWALQLLSISKVLPKAEFVPLGDIISSMRLMKSAAEIEFMKKAGKIADDIFMKVKEYIKPGMSEIEVAAFMEYEMRRLGADGPSFETIVGSGPNSALPHYNPGDKKIGTGEFVVLDFGAIYKGYCADTTRTLCVGEPTEKMLEVHNIVREAQEIGVKTIKPGIKAKEVDLAVRNHIESKGYGKYFTHRTGHGIGLEVHEEPFISAIGEKILEPGMAFSIEPGIYIEGEFGVRIEDIVIVTADGCIRMNNSPRELFCVK